jgi:nitrogen regulatory protein P-II 1
MKLIIAIVRSDKLEATQRELAAVEVFRLRVLEVQGFGRLLGFTEVHRGREVEVNLLRKLQLEIAVNDNFVEPAVEAIIKGGRTVPDGKIGDGNILVVPLEECVRIRTGERGSAAI